MAEKLINPHGDKLINGYCDNSQSKESFAERLDDCLKKIFLTKN